MSKRLTVGCRSIHLSLFTLQYSYQAPPDTYIPADYMYSILSGSLPAQVNPLFINLFKKCAQWFEWHKRSTHNPFTCQLDIVPAHSIRFKAGKVIHAWQLTLRPHHPPTLCPRHSCSTLLLLCIFLCVFPVTATNDGIELQERISFSCSQQERNYGQNFEVWMVSQHTEKWDSYQELESVILFMQFCAFYAKCKQQLYALAGLHS